MKEKTKGIKHYKKIDQKYKGYGKPQQIDVYESEFNKTNIGSIIKILRMNKKLTQEQFGRIIGLKKAEISKLESGNRNITIDKLIKLLYALSAVASLTIESHDHKNK